MSEGSALRGVFIPLPLRLRKRHRRGSGEGIRAKDREKYYKMLSTGHDTAIANMTHSSCACQWGRDISGTFKTQTGVWEELMKKHPSCWLRIDPRWGTVMIFSCRIQGWTHQAPVDSSKLGTSQMILVRLSGVTRQNRKSWVWERDTDGTRSGRTRVEGRVEKAGKS